MDTGIAVAGNVMTIGQMRRRFSQRAFQSEQFSMTPLIHFESVAEKLTSEHGILIGVVCNGTAKAVINGREFGLRRNSIFLLNEESEVSSFKCSKACMGYILTYSRKFVEGVDVDIKDLMSARKAFCTKPCRALSESDAARLHNVATTLSEMVDDVDVIYGDKVVIALFYAFFYTLASVMATSEEVADRRVLRGEEIFHKFIAILGEECEQQRSVEYYASRLNITPKYLLMICRAQTDKSTLKIIDEAVIRRAKDLLMQSGMSVQQVSERLNFVSQSFFGKYFKQRVGISPSRYKAQKV